MAAIRRLAAQDTMQKDKGEVRRYGCDQASDGTEYDTER